MQRRRHTQHKYYTPAPTNWPPERRALARLGVGESSESERTRGRDFYAITQSDHILDAHSALLLRRRDRLRVCVI